MTVIHEYLEQLQKQAKDGQDCWTISSKSYPTLPIDVSAFNWVFELSDGVRQLYAVRTIVIERDVIFEQREFYSLYAIESGKHVYMSRDVEDDQRLLKELVDILEEKNLDTQEFLRGIS